VNKSALRREEAPAGVSGYARQKDTPNQVRQATRRPVSRQSRYSFTPSRVRGLHAARETQMNHTPQQEVDAHPSTPGTDTPTVALRPVRPWRSLRTSTASAPQARRTCPPVRTNAQDLFSTECRSTLPENAFSRARHGVVVRLSPPARRGKRAICVSEYS